MYYRGTHESSFSVKKDSVHCPIYFIKLNLRVCLSICSLYKLQFWADWHETWYEATLGHWAEHSQVGDTHNLPQGEQPVVAGCKPVVVNYITASACGYRNCHILNLLIDVGYDLIFYSSFHFSVH